jgi:hypothetical protein
LTKVTPVENLPPVPTTPAVNLLPVFNDTSSRHAVTTISDC